MVMVIMVIDDFKLSLFLREMMLLLMIFTFK